MLEPFDLATCHVSANQKPTSRRDTKQLTVLKRCWLRSHLLDLVSCLIFYYLTLLFTADNFFSSSGINLFLSTWIRCHHYFMIIVSLQLSDATCGHGILAYFVM